MQNSTIMPKIIRAIRQKFGHVRHLPTDLIGSGTEAAAIALRVYVRFATKESAIACAGELHGKQFDGRAVQADFISEALFEAVQALPCFV